MTIAIKPTASGATIEQNGSAILTVDGSGNITPTNGLYPKGPAFSAYCSSQQSVSPNTWTKLQYNTEDFDTNSNYDTTNYRFTPTVSGYYQVNWIIIVPEISGGTTEVVTKLYKNGVEYTWGNNFQTASNHWNASNGNDLVYMNGTTDYLEMYIYMNIGSTVNVPSTTTSVNRSRFSSVLVSV